MAQFSTKERLIASILSSSPKLKVCIKKIYVWISYKIYRKKYNHRFVNLHLKHSISLIEPLQNGAETFFGYYDKSLENKAGLIIFNETKYPTTKKPTSNCPIWINIFNRNTYECIPVGDTLSYNWQQGARAQWLDNNTLIYNYFDTEYKSAIFDITKKKVVSTFDYPVQVSYKDQYFLSINYARIMRLRPDYGYRNLPLLSDNEMKSLDNDGIWKVDIATSKTLLLISLRDIVNLSAKPIFNSSLHKVNHVMIAPDGKKFIFIHRWYLGQQRFDRLILFDFNGMKVIADEKMVSHMCWVDDTTLFGYLRHNSKDGFYFINIITEEYTQCNTLTNLGNGDGHPSCHGKWIVLDTYPDKSRMQHLYLYDHTTDTVEELLEVFQAVKYQGESRCDLHPRFSPDGQRIYFDTVYTGQRRLAYIDISSIVN